MSKTMPGMILHFRTATLMMTLQELRQEMTLSRTILREYTATHRRMLRAGRSLDRNGIIEYTQRMQDVLHAWTREFERYRLLNDQYCTALKHAGQGTPDQM